MDGLLKGLKNKDRQRQLLQYIIETAAKRQPEGYFNMIETESLVLDKAKFPDWKEMWTQLSSSAI